MITLLRTCNISTIELLSVSQFHDGKFPTQFLACSCNTLSEGIEYTGAHNSKVEVSNVENEKLNKNGIMAYFEEICRTHTFYV